MKENRIALYKFLSIGFTYPNDGFKEILQKSVELISKAYTALNKDNYRITGIKNLKQGIKEITDMSLEEWQGIYTSLFISGFPKTPLHPYESFYKEGLLVSDSSNEVSEIYNNCGVEIFDNKEFPDFISLEMEFAAFIIENQEGCLPVFRAFFFDHLFSWVFNFFNDVINYKDAPLLYRSLSNIGSCFLKKEKNILRRVANEK